MKTPCSYENCCLSYPKWCPIDFDRNVNKHHLEPPSNHNQVEDPPPKRPMHLFIRGKTKQNFSFFLCSLRHQGSTYRSIGIENHVFRWSGLFHQGGRRIDDLGDISPDEQKNTRRSSHPWREISYNIFIKGVIKVYNFYRRMEYDSNDWQPGVWPILACWRSTRWL